VAEIEDAGEPALLVQHQVVEVEVAVYDLGAQPWPFGQHTLLETVERPRDEGVALRALDLLEQRAQPRGRADVPEELAAGRRMEEGAEREAKAGMGSRDGVHRGVVELRTALVALSALE